MAVSVRVGAALSSLLDGKREVETEGATVGEIVRALGLGERLCDGGGKLRRHFNVHVNEGEDVRLLGGLDTPIKDGDTVTILSAIAGGGKVSRKVWLTFPEKLIERPLIWEVGQMFKVVTNIRQASISKEVGLVGLELSGEEDEVWCAIEFFTKHGVTVEPIELSVVE
ncbi:MAG: MoaD/ThiS family protein [Planctomycetota bacterium]|jgi:molybdopterin converting factor small subunit